MPHPSSLACTTTTATPSPPDTQPPPPPPAARRRGNPTIALIPRCGTRTRAGCPCRAPAIHGKQRCRMHGGRSTGPRTTEGMARLRAARTTHGRNNAVARARVRHHVSFLRRANVRMFAVIHEDRLPAELAARLLQMAPELEVPPRPTRGITRAEGRALLQAETAALAPWKQAMALDREARRADRAARTTASGAKAAARATPHAPEQAAAAAASGSAASASAFSPARPKPHAPIPAAPVPARSHPASASVRAAQNRWQNPWHQNAPRMDRAAPRARQIRQRRQNPCTNSPGRGPAHLATGPGDSSCRTISKPSCTRDRRPHGGRPSGGTVPCSRATGGNTASTRAGQGGGGCVTHVCPQPRSTPLAAQTGAPAAEAGRNRPAMLTGAYAWWGVGSQAVSRRLG